MLLALAALAVSCKAARKSETSELQNLVSSSDSVSNVALVLGASSSGPGHLPGVDTDVDLFSKQLSSVFGKRSLKVYADTDVKKADFLKFVQSSASEVSDDYGTFIFYFSGHGSKDGRLNAEDGLEVSLKEIRAAIAKGRIGMQPFARLVILLDSCYSGNWVDGKQRIGASLAGEDPQDATRGSANALAEAFSADIAAIKRDEERAAPPAEMALASADGLFRELMVLTSSTKYQESEDTGRRFGGAFTQTMRGYIEAADASVTLADFAEAVTATVSRRFDHTPEHRFVPNNLGSERLFGDTYLKPDQVVHTYSSDLAAEISRKTGCKVTVRATTGRDSTGRYRLVMTNETKGRTFSTWSTVVRSSQSEASDFVDQLGEDFLARCR